jgi:hypothetical protein
MLTLLVLFSCAVGILSGAPTELIAGAIGADLAWVGSAFLGAISVVSEVKWLWFIIQVGAFVIVAHHLIVLFKAAAEAKGGEIAQLYGKVCATPCPRFPSLQMQRGRERERASIQNARSLSVCLPRRLSSECSCVDLLFLVSRASLGELPHLPDVGVLPRGVALLRGLCLVLHLFRGLRLRHPRHCLQGRPLLHAHVGQRRAQRVWNREPGVCLDRQ